MSVLTILSVVPEAMLSWAGSKPWALIGRVPRVVVLLGAGALLSAGVVVSAGFCFAGRVVEPCTSVVFVSVIVASGIAYISRFKVCAPLRHTRFSASCSSLLLFGSRPAGPAPLCKAPRDAPMVD